MAPGKKHQNFYTSQPQKYQQKIEWTHSADVTGSRFWDLSQF